MDDDDNLYTHRHSYIHTYIHAYTQIDSITYIHTLLQYTRQKLGHVVNQLEMDLATNTPISPAILGGLIRGLYWPNL